MLVPLKTTGITLTLLCFFTAKSWPVSNADSLRAVIVQNNNDTAVLNALNTLAWDIYYNNPDEAIVLENQAIVIAQKLNAQLGEARALNTRGLAYWANNQLDSALTDFQSSLRLWEQATHLEGMASSLTNMGIIEERKGAYKNALQYYQRAMELYQQLGNQLDIAVLCINLGNAYSAQANYTKALEVHFKALSIYESLEEKENLAVLLLNIGYDYANMEQYENAMPYYEQSLQLRKEAKDYRGMALLYNNMGIASYSSNGNDSAAVAYFEKAATIYIELKDEIGLARVYNNFGFLYQETGRLNDAQAYQQKALTIQQRLKEHRQVAFSLLGLGEIQFMQGNHAAATHTLNEALAITTRLKMKLETRDIYKDLAANYEALGQYKKAYEMQRLFKVMADSLSNHENTRKITQLEMQHEFDQQQRVDSLEQVKRDIAQAAKLEQKELEAATQTKLTYAFVGMFLLALILAYVLYRRNMERKKAHQELQLQHQRADREKQKVEAMNGELIDAYSNMRKLEEFKQTMTGMIVHDLKSPLSSIIGYTEFEPSEIIQQKVRQTSNNMLHMVSNILDVQRFEDAEVVLNLQEGSIKHVAQNAIDQLQPLANQKSITIAEHIPEQATALFDEHLIERVFVNILSNAIQHTPEAGNIALKAVSTTKSLTIRVTDSGEGIPVTDHELVFEKFSQRQGATARHSKGLGLTFCKMVVEAHRGSIGIDLEAGHGNTIFFSLPT